MKKDQKRGNEDKIKALRELSITDKTTSFKHLLSFHSFQQFHVKLPTSYLQDHYPWLSRHAMLK